MPVKVNMECFVKDQNPTWRATHIALKLAPNQKFRIKGQHLMTVYFIDSYGLPRMAEGFGDLMGMFQFVSLLEDPSQIIREPILTKEQKDRLSALRDLCAVHWLAKDQWGSLWAYEKMPTKNLGGYWIAKPGRLVKEDPGSLLASLVCWEDEGPFDIDEALARENAKC